MPQIADVRDYLNKNPLFWHESVRRRFPRGFEMKTGDVERYAFPTGKLTLMQESEYSMWARAGWITTVCSTDKFGMMVYFVLQRSG